MVRWVFVLFGAGVLSGCAASVDAVPAQTVVTSASVAAPVVAKEAAPAATLGRDAELGGKEHHVSLLEGKISFKVHATETPRIATRSTSKGLLYSTLDAEIGPQQTVHCVAYKSLLWPGGFVANDLQGAHDWANDGSEKPDAEAGTKSALTRLDVTTIGGRPTINARASVTKDAGVVADRKVVLTASSELMFSCSDRTIGFDKRFNAFAGEAMGSLKIESGASVPKKTSLYRIEEDGKAFGYREVNSYVEKGSTVTYTSESGVVVTKDGRLAGIDRVVSSTANARGEETEVGEQVMINGAVELENVTAKRDKQGWRVSGTNDNKAIDARYPAKTALVSEMSPAWMARVKAAGAGAGAGKKNAPKLALFEGKAEAPVPVTAKKNADGTITYVTSNGEHTVTLDGDGVAALREEKMKYVRVRAESGK